MSGSSTSLTTSVPDITFSAAGPVAPAVTDVVTGTESDINGAFGGTLNMDDRTPQGQLAGSLAAIIQDKNGAFLSLTAMVDPATSSGIWQDAIGLIYFMTRLPATATTVACICAGAPGTVINQGTLAQDTSGNTYTSSAAATISASGSVTVQFACTTTGPIPCASGAISLAQSVPGLTSVTNPSEGVIGSDVEAARHSKRAGSRPWRPIPPE